MGIGSFFKKVGRTITGTADTVGSTVGWYSKSNSLCNCNQQCKRECSRT